MASKSAELLMCPICMDLFNDPVTIPCGHSFCQTCVLGYWNSLSNSDPLCPVCREAPMAHEVSINFVLRNIVESFKKNMADVPELAAYPTPAQGYFVTCDECLGESRPEAVKFCLVCLASYCGEHRESHGGRFPKHKLVESVSVLRTVIDELMDKHATMEAASVEFNLSALRTREEMEMRVRQVESQIGPVGQLRAVVDEMEGTLTLWNQKLNNKLADLVAAINRLEEMLGLSNPAHFLQNIPAIGVAFAVNAQDCSAVLAEVSSTFFKKMARITSACVFITNKDAVKQVAISVSLDQTTAHPALIIGGRANNCLRVASSKRNRFYVGSAQRFTRQPCVLGTQPLLSDSFWEVTMAYFDDWAEQRAASWFVGVATESAMAGPPPDTFRCPSDSHWVLTCKEGQLGVHGRLLQAATGEGRWHVGVRYSRGERSVSFYDTTCHRHLHTLTGIRRGARLFPVFCPNLGKKAFSGCMTVTSA